MEPEAESDQPSRSLDPELQREVDRARRDIKLVGFVSIGLIGIMILLTIVAVLLAYGD